MEEATQQSSLDRLIDRAEVPMLWLAGVAVALYLVELRGVFASAGLAIGLAINAVSSMASSGSDKEMHIDAYNAQLDKRIAEIKAACQM